MHEDEKNNLENAEKGHQVISTGSLDDQSSLISKKTVLSKPDEQSITSALSEKVRLVENLDEQIKEADIITQNLLKQSSIDQPIKSVQSAKTEKNRFVDELVEYIKEADNMTQKLAEITGELKAKISKT